MKLESYQRIVELNLDGTKRKYVKTPAFGYPGFFEVFPYIEEKREEAENGRSLDEPPIFINTRHPNNHDISKYGPVIEKETVSDLEQKLYESSRFQDGTRIQVMFNPNGVNDTIIGQYPLPPRHINPDVFVDGDRHATYDLRGNPMWHQGVPAQKDDRNKKKKGGSTDWPPRRVIPFMPPPIDASLQSVVGIRDIPNDEKKTYVLNDWRKGIHNMENATNKGLVVTPQNDSTWYPYDSYEGGAKTVYDGLKLNPGTDAERIIKEQGYLTNFQAKGLLWDALSDHYDKAKKTYEATVGDGSWDELSIEEQKVLADYSYTGVLHEFKNFMRGIKNKDSEIIRREYKRYINGKPLKSRNDETKKQLEHIIDSHGYRSPNK